MRLLSVALTVVVLNLAGQALALERGNNGPQVQNIQKCLQKLGYFHGPLNGNFGALTEEAVRKFQQANRINAIGKVGPQTQRALEVACRSRQSYTSTSNVLKLGSIGPAVTKLQQDLRNRGFYNGPITGYFGSETQQAVSRFQQANRLQVDGIAGGRTLEVIRVGSRPSNINYHNNAGSSDNFPYALNEGDAGSQVTQLQRNLQQLGYLQANPTGNFGPLTKNAVVRFQQHYGLTPNGIADTQTLAAISRALTTNSTSGCSTTSGYICLGENSPRVLAVQQRLRERGFFRGDITGYYGAETTDAVAQFQRYAGLNPTGVVDFQTWQALGLTNVVTPENRNSTVENRYVVVVPIRDGDTLNKVLEYVPQAFAAKSKLGDYVNAGAFRDRTDAQKHSKFLRDRGFDARVEFF